MKQTQKLKLSTIIKRVAAVTALLALFEVAFIYFYMNGKHSKKVATGKSAGLKQPADSAVKNTEEAEIIQKKQPPKHEEAQPQTINTTPPAVTAASPATTLPATTQPATKAPAKVVVATPPITKPPVASTQASVAKPVAEKKNADTVKKKLQPPPAEAVKAIAQRELTHQEMVQLLNDINAKRASLNNQTKCIQIRKTQASNIDNGFEIATFLKQNGFIISGREVVSSNNTGISIDASESCIKLTIGTL